MIVEALLFVVGLILSVLDVLVPDFAFPFEPELAEYASFVGNGFASQSGVLPISTMLDNLQFLAFVYLPLKYFYVVVLWVYERVPLL